MVAAVPYLGYMLDFVRSKNGLLFLIIIPGLVIIVLEVIKIFRISAEMQRDEEEKRKKQEQPPDGEATMPDLETTITTFDE